MSVTETKAAHTPGPWTFRVERDATEHSSARFFVDGPAATGRGRWVLAETKALPPSALNEAEANAHLIAAAPDLLAVARRFLEMYDDVRNSVGPSVRAAIDQAERAIANAEGRS